MQFGFGVLVLAAGIGGIPPTIFEAARLDGATGWRLARSITIPLLGPQLFFLVVVSTIHALQSFGQIHILTRGGPDGATTTLVYSIYEQAFAFGSSNFGLASAQALVLLLIVLACTALQFGVLERKVHYSMSRRFSGGRRAGWCWSSPRSACCSRSTTPSWGR